MSTVSLQDAVCPRPARAGPLSVAALGANYQVDFPHTRFHTCSYFSLLAPAVFSHYPTRYFLDRCTVHAFFLPFSLSSR